MRRGCLICPKTFGTVRCVHCVKSAENKTEKPPDCSSDGFVLVGDERIELPQVESESTALPLCKSPIFYFVSCGVSRSTCAIIPANAVLVKPVFEKSCTFLATNAAAQKFPALKRHPAHRRTEESGPWAGCAFIRAYCSRNRPARFPVRQGRADTAGASNGAGTAADSPALQSGRPEAAPRPCPPGCG